MRYFLARKLRAFAQWLTQPNKWALFWFQIANWIAPADDKQKTMTATVRHRHER